MSGSAQPGDGRPDGPHAGRTGPRLDQPARLALALGTVGLAYRGVLLWLGVPASNSDEATFGLAALHIAQGRETPIFLYGQHYMGTVEAYLAAPLFAAFGPSWLLLRLPLLGLYALFVLLMYRLTRHLYSPWLAVVTVGLLALGSERVIRDQVTAVGGRPEIKAALVGLLLLTLGLAEHRLRPRWLGYAGFGLIAGLAVWDDWLSLPYLAAIAPVLLLTGGRELLGRAGAVLLTGFAVGVLPLVVDNLRAPPGQDTLSVIARLGQGDAGPAPLVDKLSATALTGVPLATGLCPAAGCPAWASWWGLLYPALLVAGAGIAVAGLRGPPTRWPVRRLGQLALLGGAALALVAYARNPQSATSPLASARYLSVLQVSLPAVLWPLWLAATRGWPARLALAGLLAAMLVGTAGQIGAVGETRRQEQAAGHLARTLEEAGITHVYAEYWTCNRLIFNTRERVLCAVLDPGLGPGQDRYPRYAGAVRAADRPAYVVETGGVTERAVRERLRDVGATVTDAGTHRIYLPRRSAHP